jgi:hypothetical protein
MSLVHIDKIRPKIPTKIRGVYKTPVNGGELQDNWNMSGGTTGWSSAGVTLEAVTDGGEDAVKITANDGSADRGELAISGLVIGQQYIMVVRARRGAQGTNQQVLAPTWCSITTASIDYAHYENYEFSVTATAISGVTRIYVAQFGSAGDEVYVSSISIREV